MKNKMLLIMIAMLYVVALSLSGCGDSSPKTLEDYIANNATAKEQIEKALTSIENDEMSVDLDCKENTIILTGKLKTTYASDIAEVLKESFETNSKEVSSSFAEVLTQLRDTTKIDDISIKVVINNGDGTEIWSKTYQ